MKHHEFEKRPIMLPLLLIAIIYPLAAWALPNKLTQPPEAKVFDLTVTWEKHAPDGVARDMLLVNGRSPGLTIEVEQNDWVVVNVMNKSPFNTSVHFHGMCMNIKPHPPVIHFLY
jgi:FtsP/CotA-like multicopper oxidase with cupredoxin domain